MSELKIKVAESSDLIAINEFLVTHFHDKEPLERSHVNKVDKMIPDNEFLLDCISHETTLLAFFDDELVGILLSGKILPDEAERNLENAKHLTSEKCADILKFISYNEWKADFCNKMAVPYCLHIHIISVHSEYQSLGVGKKLVSDCIEIGRVKSFPAFSIDCSNFYTSRIAEKFGMTLVSTVTYDEYNRHIGEEKFIPSEPHTVIKSFAKVYE